MNLCLALALTVISSSLVFADGTPLPLSQQAGPTVAENDPAPELLGLEKALAREQEAKGPDSPTPAQYQEFVARFRGALDAAMARVAPTASNQSVHARILVRLGDSDAALQGLNTALQRDPKNPKLAAAKAYVLYDRRDFAAAAAAANAILKNDPKNQDGLWLKHASEDRKAPSLRLPGSPWGAGPEAQGVVSAASSNDAGKPYTLAVPLRATPAPPNYSPSSEPDSPPAKKSPLVPLAAAGVLLWIGAGLAARQAQDRAVDAVSQEGEKALGKAAVLAERGKELIEDHPYAAGTAVVGAIALGAWLAAPLALGGGGPTLLAVGAAGGAPIAGAAAAASAAPVATAAAGAATLALSANGDSSAPSGQAESNHEKSLTDAEAERLETEATSSDPADKGGKLTKAGRSLAKHSSRPGSILKASEGTPSEINRQAQELVHEILKNPRSVESGNSSVWGKVLDIRGSNGLGIRYTSAGKFLYFLD